MRELKLLYEDNNIIAIDKPAGLAVQGGKDIKISVVDILEKQLGYKPYLVHRLDKDTSGVLILAKNKKSANKLNELFKEKSNKVNGSDCNLKKIYCAICSGSFISDKGVFQDDIKVKGVLKKAITRYTVIKRIGKFSMLELEIETGRMHQIRIHLAKNGHPVLGDDKYGNFTLNKKIKKNYGIKKLMLFSKKIILNLDRKIEIEAPFPEHFILFFNCFGQKI